MRPIMVLQGATFGCMKTIGQRELRNDNAEVLRGVEAGETYLITRRGVPVARLMPLAAEPDLRCDRPATRRSTYSDSPDRKSTRLNSSHIQKSRMPSSA